MGIAEVLSAPASPWQSPDVERVIGSIRREYLAHLNVFNESEEHGLTACDLTDPASQVCHYSLPAFEGVTPMLCMMNA